MKIQHGARMLAVLGGVAALAIAVAGPATAAPKGPVDAPLGNTPVAGLMNGPVGSALPTGNLPTDTLPGGQMLGR
jgi:hypothetical protein